MGIFQQMGSAMSTVDGRLFTKQSGFHFAIDFTIGTKMRKRCSSGFGCWQKVRELTGLANDPCGSGIGVFRRGGSF